MVTETEEFEGGVLVDEAGTIEAVLKRDSVELLLSSERSRGWQVSIIIYLHFSVING